MLQLTATQGRVIGSLIEKQLTTPQQYPLTANALLLACNQTTNRDPVVAYTEGDLEAALEGLRQQRLVRFVLPSHGRSVVRYRHVLDEVLGLDGRSLAVMAVLLLRGPQTVGELRTRTERMAAFDGLAGVEHELERLAGAEEPLVARLARRPGQKEERWTELSGASGAGDGDFVDGAARVGEPTTGEPTTGEPTTGEPTTGEPWRVLDALSDLRSQVAQLRAELKELRDSLGG